MSSIRQQVTHGSSAPFCPSSFLAPPLPLPFSRLVQTRSNKHLVASAETLAAERARATRLESRVMELESRLLLKDTRR